MDNLTIDQKQIGQNIRKIRMMCKLTQEGMAELLQYSDRQYRRLESEGTNNISVINIIADKCNINALSILSGCF